MNGPVHIIGIALFVIQKTGKQLPNFGGEKGAFAFVTRGFTAGIMSLSGGLLSTLAMWLLLKFTDNKLGLVGISVICALCHNAGQLGAAAVITGSGDIIYYAPALAVFGIATGTITGIILKAVIPVLEKQKQYFYR